MIINIFLQEAETFAKENNLGVGVDTVFLHLFPNNVFDLSVPYYFITIIVLVTFQTTDISEIALKIAALPKEDNKPRTVVITQGSNPTVVAKGQNHGLFFHKVCT
jgi:hypothetical protein